MVTGLDEHDRGTFFCCGLVLPAVKLCVADGKFSGDRVMIYRGVGGRRHWVVVLYTGGRQARIL